MHLRWIIGLILTTLILTACTRDRVDPNAVTPEAAPQVGEIGVSVEGGDPEVVILTPTPEPAADGRTSEEVENGAVETGEGDDDSKSTPPTMSYEVKTGDTILSIAVKFGTDAEAIRRLNYQLDDNIYVGQFLDVPFVDGATAQGLPTPTPEPYLYAVRPGDTLNAIALRFNVNYSTLIEANELSNPNNLLVGQNLLIPEYQFDTLPIRQSASGSSESNESSGSRGSRSEGTASDGVHTVQAGEGLLAIANKYGVSVNDIIEANSVLNPDLVFQGTKLVIPGVSAAEIAVANQVIHRVEAGEGLISLAILYGVSSEAIADANEIENPDSIFVGQALIIPVE